MKLQPIEMLALRAAARGMVSGTLQEWPWLRSALERAGAPCYPSMTIFTMRYLAREILYKLEKEKEIMSDDRALISTRTSSKRCGCSEMIEYVGQVPSERPPAIITEFTLSRYDVTRCDAHFLLHLLDELGCEGLSRRSARVRFLIRQRLLAGKWSPALAAKARQRADAEGWGPCGQEGSEP